MRELHGESVSPGLGRGRAHIVDLGATPSCADDERTTTAEAELARLDEAIADASADLEHTSRQLATRIGERDAAILYGHVALIDDPDLRQSIESRLRSAPLSAEAAVALALDELRARFAAADQSLIRERADDVLDIKRRLLYCLSHTASPASLRGAAIVSEMLTPSEIVHFAHQNVTAFVVARCAPRSHAAILARSFGVALVSGIDVESIPPGSELLVFGRAGTVAVDPDAKQIAVFEEQLAASATALRAPAGACLRDGTPVTLLMNISDPVEVEAQPSAYGVGLFRTEFLYMDREDWPSAADEVLAYQRVADAAGEHEVHIRLADFGGDKCPPYADIPFSRNPSLSQRGLRWLLENDRVLSTQVRALGEVSRRRRITVLLPMVDTVDTLDRVLDRMRDMLDVRPGSDLPFAVGAMIEVPAAAVQVVEILGRVDCLSIGLNDLTQYLLAADRDDDALRGYHDPLQPAVLRTVSQLLVAARAAGKPVTMCGELAGDRRLAVALIALGARRFSVARAQLGEVTTVIRSIHPADLAALSAAVLSAETGKDVKDAIHAWERTSADLATIRP